jgi:hypothetical protein
VRYPWLALLVFSFLSSCPALAGPREDSLAGISRCASLPDDRTLLDCIYGAVQPLRSELNLPPALPAQQKLVPPRDPSLARSIQPPAAQALPAPQTTSAQQSTGLFSGIFASGLHLAAYSFDHRGLFTVTLSDGSVWRQDPSDTNYAHFGGKPSEYEVSLHPGDFGKVRMSVRGAEGLYMVQRIR